MSLDILNSDHRRAAVVAAFVVVLIVCVLVGVALLTRPKTQFDRLHAQAMIRNPPRLKVEIATRNGRREYREGEDIFLIVHFSSSALQMYKADVADGVSTSAASDVLHISDGGQRP